MCREVKLSSTETNHQIIEGLCSRDLCFYLLACDHSDEDSLLTDILLFITMNSTQHTHFKTALQPPLNSVRPSLIQKAHTTKALCFATSASKQPPSANPTSSVMRCLIVSHMIITPHHILNQKMSLAYVSNAASHYISYVVAQHELKTIKKL